ncbi:MAG: TolC family protein [Bacteroidota bacterium]
MNALLIVLLFTAGDPATATATLTLERAIDTALRNQPAVQQARASTEAAEGRVDQATSGLLPQIAINATYQRTTGNFSPRPGATSSAVQMAPPWSTSTYNFFNAGVTASQLIYDFGQTPARRRAAIAGKDAVQAAERTAAFNVRLAVLQAFFRARAQKALIGVARAGVDNQQRHVDQIKGFTAAGLRPEIDLARVKTDLANARVVLINTQNAYDLAKAQLDQSMGVSAPAPYDVADNDLPAVDGEDAAAARLVEDALARRPELTALERQRLAQTQVASSLKGAYGPSLAATAAATETGTSLDRLVPNWLLGATLSWPIFQGGLTRGQVREANANVRVLDAQLDAFRLQVRLEIEQALLAVRAAKASIDAVAEAETSAREQLRLAEGRYRTGLGNAIELSDAQQALFGAEAQTVQAAFNLASARAQLLTALGKT